MRQQIKRQSRYCNGHYHFLQVDGDGEKDLDQAIQANCVEEADLFLDNIQLDLFSDFVGESIPTEQKMTGPDLAEGIHSGFLNVDEEENLKNRAEIIHGKSSEEEYQAEKSPSEDRIPEAAANFFILSVEDDYSDNVLFLEPNPNDIISIKEPNNNIMASPYLKHPASDFCQSSEQKFQQPLYNCYSLSAGDSCAKGLLHEDNGAFQDYDSDLSSKL